MFRSYLLTALRSLTRRKGYTAINLIGMATGLAAVVLICLYARHELTYDRFHERSDRIYQVYKERVTPTGTQVTRDTWLPLGERLEREYPTVVESVRLFESTEWVRHGAARFEQSVTYADDTLFDVFSFALIRGDAATALDDPASIVLSSAVAERYFGDQDPLGQVLQVGGTLDYTVTGVFADFPANSSFDMEAAISFRGAPWYADAADGWGSSFIYTYILLDDAASASELEAQFPVLVERIWDAEVASRTNFRLEALTDLYDALTGNRQYAYLLLGLAGIILLIAAINFVNLATARSTERAREIGMRKVLGARRQQVMRQYLGESILLSVCALVLALALVASLLPAFNSLYGLELTLAPLTQPKVFVLLLVGGVVVGMAAGLYPAVFISAFNPILALRGGRRAERGRGLHLRHALVVTQFTLAIALISATMVMNAQIQYMQHAELKFDSGQIAVIPVSQDDVDDPEAAAARLETFKAELARTPAIASVSSASHAPGRWEGWFTFAEPEGWADRDPLRMRLSFVDDAYFSTYGIELVEGRAFTRDRASDAENAVIVNEAALAEFGWTSAEGRRLYRGDREFIIIGVARDYHFESLRDGIAPVLHFYRPPDNGIHQFVAARIEPGAERGAVEAMQSAWSIVDATRPMPYDFADGTFARLYEAEQRLVAVAGTFTILSILIACMGLLGLASWSVSRRMKEVGIRKVLGASVPQVVALLSADFLRLVAIALVLAAPLAYLGTRAWLNEFAYRIEVDPSILAIAGAVALVIAFLTVSLTAGRAALTNPAQTLKYE